MNSSNPEPRQRPTAVARQATASSAPRALLVLLAALALAIAGLVWGAAGSASAHDELLSSTPADGDTLDAAPDGATLEFSGNVQEVGTEFQLQDASGNAVELTDEYSISGTSITQPLPALDDGAYTLNWRVVSEDGHPISGSIGFTVGEAALGNNEATSGGQFQNEQVDPDSVNLPTDDADSGTNPWLVGIMSFVGVLVIGGAAALMVMRMRRGNQPGGGSDSGSSNDGGAAGGR
jgi:methionine-rich copper-binding protein CopC